MGEGEGLRGKGGGGVQIRTLPLKRGSMVYFVFQSAGETGLLLL